MILIPEHPARLHQEPGLFVRLMFALADADVVFPERVSLSILKRSELIVIRL